MTAKRARRPCRGRSGGHVGPDVLGTVRTTLRARSVPLQGPSLSFPYNAASGPIRRDSMTFPVKLVKRA